MGAKNSCEISRLPQDCLARVISLTSPQDVCRCSAVSTNFHLAADADVVWEHFLPPGLDHILSSTEDQLVFTSKKDLYFLLTNRDILLDDGKMVCFSKLARLTYFVPYLIFLVWLSWMVLSLSFEKLRTSCEVVRGA